MATTPAQRAAIEINELWRRCFAENVHPDECPSNEEIAEIIERHLNESNTESIHSE